MSMVIRYEFEYDQLAVFAFNDPLHAQHFLINNDVPPIAVISDYQMPRLNGVDLINTVQKHRKVHALIISSAPEEVEPSKNYTIASKTNYREAICDFLTGILD